MGILRSALERISRGKYFKRSIKVNGKTVPLFVSPDSALRYLKPRMDVANDGLVEIAEKFLNKNSSVWDIGANLGFFTFASAAIATEGVVVSIEADVWLASLLRRSMNLKPNRDKNICIVPVAISNENSVASFLIAKRGRSSNALRTGKGGGGRSDMGGVREVQHVPTLKLDTLLKSMPEPDFVKIDVEGAELMVLEGAEHVIHKSRPVFYIEVGEEASSAILEIFSHASYIAVSPKGERLKEQCAFNTFFIPEEKSEYLQILEISPI